MSGLDLSNLSASDAAVALRSYPRRFREALHGVRGDVDEVGHRVGPQGHSALDLVVHSTSSFVLLGQALHQILVSDAPVLHAAVLDDDERHWDVPPGATVEGELARLKDEAEALATTIGNTHGDAWSRPATIAGGGSVHAIDVAREAVRTGADDLHALEAVLRAVARG